MTPDAHFNRWMKRAIFLFMAIFAYLIVADVTIPMTSYATLQRPVLSIAPQVSGKVTEVAVHNNARVQQGDLLFKIEDTDYLLAVQQAELALQQAYQRNQTLKANIAEAEAEFASVNVTLQENKREYQRLLKLQKQDVISDQQVEQAQTKVRASQANLSAIEARKSAILIELGDEHNNLDVSNAKNALANARLNLSRTAIYAPQDGVVSNMQLVPGMVTQSNQSLLSLVVTGHDRITADYREKSITHVQPGTAALIVYDAFPGEVFEGTLTSRDYGIAQGQNMANGVLATPDDSDRWVRDAQRIRVYIEQQHDNLPDSLVSGSKATVMVMASDASALRFIGHLQMHTVSLLHYVY